MWSCSLHLLQLRHRQRISLASRLLDVLGTLDDAPLSLREPGRAPVGTLYLALLSHGYLTSRCPIGFSVSPPLPCGRLALPSTARWPGRDKGDTPKHHHHHCGPS